VAKRRDEEKGSPEEPADPVDGSGEEEEKGQDVGEQAVQARRERVEDVAAVELAAGIRLSAVMNRPIQPATRMGCGEA